MREPLDSHPVKNMDQPCSVLLSEAAMAVVRVRLAAIRGEGGQAVKSFDAQTARCILSDLQYATVSLDGSMGRFLVP